LHGRSRPRSARPGRRARATAPREGGGGRPEASSIARPRGGGSTPRAAPALLVGGYWAATRVLNRWRPAEQSASPSPRAYPAAALNASSRRVHTRKVPRSPERTWMSACSEGPWHPKASAVRKGLRDCSERGGSAIEDRADRVYCSECPGRVPRDPDAARGWATSVRATTEVAGSACLVAAVPTRRCSQRDGSAVQPDRRGRPPQELVS